jgi:hypothetical protein
MPLLLDSLESSPPLSPISPTSPTIASYSRRSRRLIPRLCQSGAVAFAWITLVCLCGAFLALFLSVFRSPPPDGRLFAWPFSRPGQPGLKFDNTRPPVSPASPHVSPVSSPVSPAPPLVSAAPPQRKHDDDHLDLEELRDLVAQTKGYFARDYSLGLGWNNVSSFE